MSRFIAGGVELTYVRTLHFGVSDEKDPSGVDQLWRVYDIRVRGAVSGGTEITNGPAALAALTEALTTPRKPVYYQMGDTVILNTAGQDARYGPDAPTVEVDEVVPGVIFATVGVKVRVASCATNAGSNEIASLRWSQEEDVDEGEQLVTLVTRGLLISRTDLRNLNADSFREAIPVPIPPKNFTRKAHYRLDETGTKLQFEFRDRQWYRLPPLGDFVGATWAEGTFAVTSNKTGGSRFAVVNLTVKGGPDTGRHALMVMAFGVAFAKLKTAKLQTDKKNNIVIDYVITEDLYRNVIQVMMRGRLHATQMDALTTAATSLFGDTPGSDDPGQDVSFGPPVRLALAGLISAAFRDPCAAAYTQPVSQAGSASASPQQYPPATISTGPVSGPTSQPSPSYKPDQGGYEWYKVENSYAWNEGVGQLPGTGVGSTPKKSKFVQVTGGMMTLEVAWSYRRRGVPGVYPAYETGDPNLKKLGAVVGPVPQLDVSGDDTPVYEASGLYRYGVEDPDKVTMAAPRPPYLSDLIAQAINLVLNYPAQSIATGGATGSGGTTPGVPPMDGGGSGGGLAGAVGAAFGRLFGSTPPTGEQPDDSLTRQLTAAEEAYIEGVVRAGGSRSAITSAVLGGLAGPSGPVPGQPPMSP